MPSSSKINSGNKRAHKTVTRTFRIRSEWDDTLQREAENKGVSVNGLLNQILRRYALYIRWADKGGIMNITRPTFNRLLNEIPEESLETLGADCGVSDVLDALNMIGKPINYDSWVYLVTEHLGGRDFQRWFTCFHHIHKGRDMFHLQHGLGLGWSKFLNQYLGNSLKSLYEVDFESKIYPFALNILVK
jgi:hypothetical protein